MNPFAYHEPRSVGEAVEVLARHGEDAVVLAGGTALVLLLKQGLLRPEHVVALRRVDELRGVARRADGGLDIGALTTHREAELSPVVRAYAPALASAFGSVATIRIRNQATVGGNLVHADPAQDPPPMLLALGADVVLAGPGGERSLPLEAFFIDFLETALRPGEVLTAVRLPPLPATVRGTYLKFLPNTRDDYPTVSVGAVVELDDAHRCREVRIGLAGVGPTPRRASSVEAALRGAALDAGTIAAAADLVERDIEPLDDGRGSAGYKRRMAQVWVRRALTRLAGSADEAVH